VTYKLPSQLRRPQGLEFHEMHAVMSGLKLRFVSGVFFHVHDGQCFAIHEGNGNRPHRDVAFFAEELGARQRGSHFVTKKSRSPGCIFAGFEDSAAYAAARPVRVDEEGADFCGVVKGIEQRILAAGPVIAAVKSFAFAPATAADKDVLRGLILLVILLTGTHFGSRMRFGNEVRSVRDQLSVDAEDRFECAFNLRGSIVFRLQAAHGSFDKFAEHGNIGGNSEAKTDRGLQEATHWLREYCQKKTIYSWQVGVLSH